jgi:hypothetical protein
LDYFVTNGPGIEGEVLQYDNSTPSFGSCGNPCYIKGAETLYDQQELYENTVDYVTNHEGIGTQWVNARYHSSAWNYVFEPDDIRQIGNPVQMYWNIDPAPGNYGGQLYSCTYFQQFI